MSPDAEPKKASAAIADEAARHAHEILYGAVFGDLETRTTMERELRARLEQALAAERPLRVYLGVDPTSPDLHLGHCVSLRKLRLFQELGHQAILLIGDFTGLVGDPSDKDSLRPMRRAEELAANARTYQEQAFKLLDPDSTEVRRNSEWLVELNFRDVVQLASQFTVAQFIERDTFRTRIDRGDPVYVHEFMYGLMQGYDAVALRADVQIGGTDQTFNIMAGRILQRSYDQSPQIAVTYPILVGLDGKARMSKSAGNHIGINEPPEEQYGKAMSIPDSVLPDFLTYATNLMEEEAIRIDLDLESGALHPMAAKRQLAHAIVTEWHGRAAADASAEHFDRVFSHREMPEEIAVFATPFRDGRPMLLIVDLLLEAGLVASKAEVKRLLGQGGIQIDGVRADDAAVPLVPGSVLKVGKRRWLRIVPS